MGPKTAKAMSPAQKSASSARKSSQPAQMAAKKNKASASDSKDPKPKKKKKTRGMKDLTDEEKAEFKEKKSAAQQEVQRRREELITAFLKTKMTKETDALRLNEIMLNDKWRGMMRNMKTESLRNQAQVSAQTFARVSEKKDEIITALMQELEEAEEQQNMVDRAHLTHLSNLLGTSKSRIKALQREYEAERNRLLTRWSALKDKIVSEGHGDAQLLADARWATESENKAMLASLHKEFNAKHESSGIVHTIRLHAEEQMDQLQKDREKLTTDHVAQTRTKWTTYSSMKSKDEAYQNEFDVQVCEIREMAAAIVSMRKKLDDDARTRAEMAGSLKDVKAEHVHELQVAKTNQLAEKLYWEKQTKTIAAESEALRKRFEQCTRQLDRILKVGSQCQKLQVMDDRAFQLMPSEAQAALALAAEEAESSSCDGSVSPTASNSPMDKIKDKASRLLDCLDPFLRQYSRVNVQTAAIGNHNAILRKESAMIKDQLRRYFEGIRLSDNAVMADETLMPICKAPQLTPGLTSVELERPKSAFPSSSCTGVQLVVRSGKPATAKTSIVSTS